ncbi:hypothetical protein FKM82_025454 [Ascaphus truei]
MCLILFTKNCYSRLASPIKRITVISFIWSYKGECFFNTFDSRWSSHARGWTPPVALTGGM